MARAARLRRPQVVEWRRGERWYRGTIDPIRDAGGLVRELLMAVGDVTADRDLRAKIAESEAARLASEARISALERDARMLLKFAEPTEPPRPPAQVESGPLKVRDSGLFCDLIAEYDALLALMIDQRNYQAEHQAEISRRLREIAERMGRQGAGPRDVVEVHGTTLRRAAQEQNAGRSRLSFEEGRLLVLELMGHLLSYYRVRQAGAEDAHARLRAIGPGDARKAN
jgi:hypothetical protein